MTKAVLIVSGYLAVVLFFQPMMVTMGQQPLLVTQTGHTGEVITVAVNGNGTLIATGGDDSTIKVWHAASRRVIRTLKGHGSPVMSLAFNSLRPLLASAGAWDKTIKIWDLEGGGPPRELTGPAVTYGTLTFSADGSWLIHGGPSGVTAWELDTSSSKHIYTGQVEALALSLDGAILAIGDTTGSIMIWRGSKKGIADTLTANPRTIRNHRDGGVFGLAISANNAWLATAGATIDVWDLRSYAHLKTLGTRSVYVKRPVAFSCDGTMLAAVDSGRVTRSRESIHSDTLGGIENTSIDLWQPGSWKKMGALIGHTKPINSIAFNPNSKSGSLVSASSDGTLRFWNLLKQTEITNPTPNVSPITSVVFTPNNQKLVISAGRELVVWDLRTGAAELELIGHKAAVTSIAVSPDGNVIASGSTDQTVKFWDASNGKVLRTFETAIDVRCIAFSPAGDILAVGGQAQGGATAAHRMEGAIVLLHLPNGERRQVINAHIGMVTTLAFAPGGKTLASGSTLVTRSGKIPEDESTVSFWHVASGKEAPNPIGRQTISTKAIAYSSDGATLAIGRAAIDPENPSKAFLAGGDMVISTIDIKTGQTESREVIKEQHGEFSNQDLRLWKASGEPMPTVPYSGIVMAVAFLPGGQVVATGGGDNSVRLWDVASGVNGKSLSGHSGIVNALAVSQDSQILASGSQDGTVVLWRLSTKEILARLVYLGEKNWIVVQEDGHFDTNNLEEISNLQWIFPDDPFRPLPPEIFMRQYYEPHLLPRVSDRATRFEPVAPLAALNRVQPQVEIANVIPVSKAENLVRVTVKVQSIKGQQMRNGRRVTLHSGARDLRLFRDGQLVDYHLGAIKLNKSGRTTLDFKVRLPRRSSQDKVEFSAYAFNESWVKSSSAKRTYHPAKGLSPRKGRAYVIAVGVNAYEDMTWDLNFAASDAQVTQRVLIQKLTKTQEYSEVIPVVLTSDYEKDANGRRIITEHSATKQNFVAVLDLLAGRRVEPKIVKAIPGANRLKKAEPEDIIFISFSSHGYTDKQGKFYLVAFDTGQEIRFSPDGSEVAPESLSRFISSDEVSELVRDIDADELVMVVDTCHSAAAVEEPGFKPGPMGSRGMGQLAYDKGMRILAASQADDVALEIESLKQGLLTYALIQEGLKNDAADHNGDGQITLDEWLAYGAQRVSTLYRDVKAGKVAELMRKDVHLTAVLSGGSVKKNAFQQPQLFDFKRKKRQVLLTRHEALSQ